MKSYTLLVLVFLSVYINAGASVKHVFAKDGINIYQQKDTSSNILGVLPWGSEVHDTATAFQYFYRNNSTHFIAVNTAAGKGYVLDMFLLALPIHQKHVSSIDSYLLQVTEPAFFIDSTYYVDTVYNGNRNSTHIKTVHKNGFISEYAINKYQGSHTITIPNLRIQSAYFFYQCFNKNNIFPPDYSYPTKNTTDVQVDKFTKRSIRIIKDKNDNVIWLRLNFEDSAISTTIDFIQVGEDVIIQDSSCI